MDTQQIVNLIISMVILVVLAIFSSGVANKFVTKRRNRKSPRLGAEVYVASKREVKKHSGKSDYFITFRLKDDNVLEFEVDEDTYNQLHEEDFIKIVFKGTVFEGFKPVEAPKEEKLPENAEKTEEPEKADQKDNAE